ncbi:hypothetical protein A0H76_114 [Hepatospora eriocheir]|uniref:Uncharacterized protein n=1 Tax=Hepatospora eriocheir TaxID=1081669 RepID=A0A1X0QJ77_9MICR|nr:hypothetical protein A0H76_114 [Hepatospora eriocheir]
MNKKNDINSKLFLIFYNSLCRDSFINETNLYELGLSIGSKLVNDFCATNYILTKITTDKEINEFINKFFNQYLDLNETVIITDNFIDLSESMLVTYGKEKGVDLFAGILQSIFKIIYNDSIKFVRKNYTIQIIK